MTTWTNDELTRIGSAEELEIQSARPDGTLRKPVTIWVVRAGDDLYIRAVKGRTGPWFRHATQTQAGHIRAGGVDTDAVFTDVGNDLNDEIDAAYRAKYGHYSSSIFEPVVADKARSATLRIVPRETSASPHS